MKKHKKTALLLATLLGVTALSGCNSGSSQTTENTAATTAATTVAGETTTVAEETTVPVATETTTEVTTTTHVSPTETVSSTLGTEVSDIDAILNRDGSNTYSALLSDFVQEGDVIESFTFIVYAEDGTSNLSEYKGAYGISVGEDYAGATKKGWYQSDDFTQSLNSSYAEFTWDVPEDVAKNIDYSGEVMFGHWWSGVQSVRLSSIVCTYTHTEEIPVDGTESEDVNATLRYNDEASKTVKIPLSDFVSEGDTVQTVTYTITSSGSLGKFTGAFGMSVDADADCATDKGWYQPKTNVCVFTDGSDLTLTWIVPEDVKEAEDLSGDLMLGYWWSDQDSITLKSVSVQYSTDGTTTHTVTKQESDNATVKNDGGTASSDVDNMSTAEIVDDIKVGWNLGNSLDSHSDSASDTETCWGNPKTTQAMIDAVQDAGFNAIRIPVTWYQNMDSAGNIDSDFLARVKEVVDYAYNNGMYVILNVHHDDEDWLVPTYDKLDSDKAILTNIWKQLCEEFKDYDHKLIFEGMNETRIIGSSTEWTGGTDEERDVINQLYQAFVDTVRASGGENAERSLIISGHAQSITEAAVSAIQVPDDDHIIVSIHSYAPWDFCGTDSNDSDWGTDADKAELDSNFQYLDNTFDVPVIIDEMGAANKDNTEARAAWFQYYISQAKKYGIKCFVWDNNEITGDSDFGLFDRDNLTWYFSDIVQAIMDGANS